jgi:hypothetical protein
MLLSHPRDRACLSHRGLPSERHHHHLHHTHGHIDALKQLPAMPNATTTFSLLKSTSFSSYSHAFLDFELQLFEQVVVLAPAERLQTACHRFYPI